MLSGWNFVATIFAVSLLCGKIRILFICVYSKVGVISYFSSQTHQTPSVKRNPISFCVIDIWYDQHKHADRGWMRHFRRLIITFAPGNRVKNSKISQFGRKLSEILCFISWCKGYHVELLYVLLGSHLQAAHNHIGYNSLVLHGLVCGI